MLGPVPDADIAVVLGDISDHVEANIDWCADQILPHMPVIYVPGNHDLYQRCINGCTQGLRRYAAQRGVVYLETDSIVLEGVRFVGGLLWSDLELWAPEDPIERAAELERRFVDFADKSDYVRIYSDKASGRFMTPQGSRARFHETLSYIEKVLKTPFSGETVVLTHFPIHVGSIQPEYIGNPQQPRYISHRPTLIEEAQPAMWLHGHTHLAVNYRVGRTLIANNPCGYSHEGTGFKWDLVHELDA